MGPKGFGPVKFMVFFRSDVPFVEAVRATLVVN